MNVSWKTEHPSVNFLVLQPILTVCCTHAYMLLLQSLFCPFCGSPAHSLYRDPSGENYFFFFAPLLLISMLINQQMRFTIGHHSLLLHSSPQSWSVHLLCWWGWLVPQDLLAGSRAGSQELLAFQQHHPSSLKMPHPSPTNTQQLLSSWAIQIALLP